MSLYSDKLFTRRLILRKIQESDLPLVTSWSGSEEACGAYLTPVKQDLEQMRRQLHSGIFWNEMEKMFLVERKEDGRPIGTAHYWSSPGRQNTVAMALKVAVPEERGKGYGTEIQKYLIMYILDQLPVGTVEMHTDINNTAQQRCLRKLGFDLVESLVYEDQQKKRTGHLFRLTAKQYHLHPIYQFHYE